jgi:hypothetical protein
MSKPVREKKKKYTEESVLGENYANSELTEFLPITLNTTVTQVDLEASIIKIITTTTVCNKIKIETS